MSAPIEITPERSSRITARDRRGLGEIVAVSMIVLAVGSVIVAQLATHHEASHELIDLLVGLVVIITGRGVQSSMERGGASEAMNREADRYRFLAEQAQAQNAQLQEALTRALVRAATTPPMPSPITVIAQPAAPSAPVDKE